MGQTAKFGIVTTVDDAAIAKLVKTLTSLPDISKLISKAWDDVAPKVKAATEKVQSVVEEGEKKITTAKQQSNERVAALLADRVAKEEKTAKQGLSISEAADRSSVASTAQYAKLKAEYESKSLDEIRSKIMAFEEQTRTLRRARAGEEDVAIKKELQARTNSINTELQLYRSLEKEKIGRTFSEQMERLGLDKKTNIEITSLLKKQAEDFAVLQRQMTVAQSAEERKRIESETEALKTETAAVQKEAERRNIVESKGGGKEGKGGMAMGGLLAGGAIAAGIGMLDSLKAHAEEARDADVKLQEGLSATGGDAKKNFEEANKSAQVLAERYKMTGTDVKSAMATVAGFTNKTGKDLEQLTNSAIVLAKQHGMSVEMVAKTLAKGTDAEVAATMTKLGIVVDKSMTAEQRMALVNAKAATAQAGVVAASNDGLGSMDHMMSVVSEGIGRAATGVINVMTPLFDILSPVLQTIGDVSGSIVEMQGPVATVIKVVAGLTLGLIAFNVAMEASIVRTTIDTAKKGLQAAATMAVTIATNVAAAATSVWSVIQTAFNAIMALNPIALVALAIAGLVIGIIAAYNHFKIVKDTVDSVWGAIKKLWDGVVSLGSGLLKLLGITKDTTAEEDKAAAALVATKKAAEDLSDSYSRLSDERKKQTDDIKQFQGEAEQFVREIDEKLAGSRARAAGETDEYLKKIRAQWVAGSKAKSKDLDEMEAADHKRDLELGIAVDNDKKKGKDTAYQKAKEQEEKNYAEARVKLETKQIEEHESEWNSKAQLLELEKKHAKDKLDVQEKYKKDPAKEKLDLLKANDAIEKNYRSGEQQDSMLAAKEESDKETEQQQKNYDEQLAALKKHDEDEFAETKRKVDQQRTDMVEQVKFFTGPIVQGFSKALNTVFAGVNRITEAWSKSKNIAVSAFGDMASGFVKMLEQMIEKLIAFGVVYETLNIITGGGASAILAALGMATDIKGALGIPGHASGTDNSPGGAFWHGENGPELYIEKPGSMVIPNHQINVGGGSQDFGPMLHALNRSNQLAERQVAHLDSLQRNSAPGYGSSQSLYNLTRGQNQAFKQVNRRQLK